MTKLTGTEETALNNACARLRETHLGTHIKTLEEFINQNKLDTESDTITEAVNELYHMIVNNDCASIQIPPPGFFTIFGNDETGDLMVYYNDEEHPPVFRHVDDPTAADDGTLYLYIADPSGDNHYELKIGEYIAVRHLEDYYTKSEIDTAFRDIETSLNGKVRNIETSLDSKASVEYVDNQIASAVAGDEIDLSTYVKFSDVEDTLSGSSVNPVQNKILKSALDNKSDTNHTHNNYLPLAGGTMTGDINLKESGGGNTVYAGTFSSVSDVLAKLKSIKSFIGSIHDGTNWWNFLSIRHRNGAGDGTNYGMYLKTAMTAAGSLIWNKQTAQNTWQGERTILDNTNYVNFLDTALSSTSTKAVQNKVINTALNGKSDTGHTHNDVSSVTTLPIINSVNISGTVKIMKKNGWAIIMFEGLKCNITTGGWAEVCTLPYVNQSGTNIYAHMSIDEQPAIRVRVTSNYLELYQYVADKRVYGHIVYPTTS